MGQEEPKKHESQLIMLPVLKPIPNAVPVKIGEIFPSNGGVAHGLSIDSTNPSKLFDVYPMNRKWLTTYQYSTDLSGLQYGHNHWVWLTTLG